MTWIGGLAMRRFGRPAQKVAGATSPGVVEFVEAGTQYGFRLRTRNQEGEISPWSDETLVTPLDLAPVVAPVPNLASDVVLGRVVPYLGYVNLRKGQTIQLGASLFNVDGNLDNSIADRDDVSIAWRSSIGDLSNPNERLTTYTAPHRVGDFAVYVVVTQEVAGDDVVDPTSDTSPRIVRDYRSRNLHRRWAGLLMLRTKVKRIGWCITMRVASTQTRRSILRRFRCRLDRYLCVIGWGHPVG